MNSFNFTSPENVFISLLFLKDIFIRYQILGWQTFSSRAFKMLLCFLLVFVVFDEKSTVILIIVLLQIMCHFSLSTFNIFFCSFQ